MYSLPVKALLTVLSASLVSTMPMSRHTNLLHCELAQQDPNFCTSTCQSGMYDTTIAECCRKSCLMINEDTCFTSFRRWHDDNDQAHGNGHSIEDRIRSSRNNIFACGRVFEPVCAQVGNNGTVEAHYSACALCEKLVQLVHVLTYVQVDNSHCNANMMLY